MANKVLSFEDVRTKISKTVRDNNSIDPLQKDSISSDMGSYPLRIIPDKPITKRDCNS